MEIACRSRGTPRVANRLLRRVRDYAEVRGSWTDAEETHWAAVERLRPTVELQVHDRVLIAATAEAAVEQGRYPTGEFAEALREPIETAVGGLSDDGPTLEEVIEDCGWPIETKRTYDEVGDVLSLERLYVDVTSPYADFRLGRQAVNWGSALFFNPTDIFAVESTYGRPEDLKAFVKEAHRLGLAVIIDVVYNHLGPGDLDLWQFDGWKKNGKGGIYFYNDWRAPTPWGETRPDYGRGEVRQFLRDNALYWLDEFRADGLRWDMTLFIRTIAQSEQPL